MKYRTRKALTLPELLISLSVIVILATVLLPSLAGARQRAAKSAAIKTVSSLRQKSEVLLRPTATGTSTTSAKIYRDDLCSVGFLDDLSSITSRLSYTAYNPATDAYVKSTASNTDIGGNNKVTCHAKDDGTAWFVIADVDPESPNVEMYCTDYTGFAGVIPPTNLVTDFQCDPDSLATSYTLGTGFTQSNGQPICDQDDPEDCPPDTCIPGVDCEICIDNPTTPWDDCDNDCDNDGIPNAEDPCDACDADGSVGDICGPEYYSTAFNYFVRSMDKQSDGKYIMSGLFNQGGSSNVWRVARVLQTGELDTSFQTSGSSNGLKRSGETPSDSGTDVETSFTQGGGAGTAGVNVLSNGKVLLLSPGTFNPYANTTYNGSPITANGLLMLNSNGTVDTSFMNNVDQGLVCDLSSPYCGTASSIETGGKIWIGGRFTKWDDDTRTSPMSVPSGIVILNQDGTLASTQVNLTWSGSGWVAPLHVNASGQVYAGGSSSSIYQIPNTGWTTIARINSNGSVDTSFYVPANRFSSIGWIQSMFEMGGKLYISGSFTSADGQYKNIARLNSNGTIDTTFNGGSLKIEASYATYMLPLSSGKILVFGDITKHGTTNVPEVIRITSNGVLDTSFNAGNGITDVRKYRPSTFNNGSGSSVGDIGRIRAASENVDGSVTLIGEFTKWNDTLVGYTVTLGEDGAMLQSALPPDADQ